MAVNIDILKGKAGHCRIVTLVLGLVTLCLTAVKYLPIPKEEFFLAMVIIDFSISLILVALFVFEVVAVSEQSKKIDIGFHVIGGLLLIIASFVWISSIIQVENAIHATCALIPELCPPGFNQIERIVAAVLALTNGVFYALVAIFLFKEYQVDYQEIP